MWKNSLVSHFCSWSHQILYPSCRLLSCLFLLCKLIVVCQPGDTDMENYLEQLTAELESWKFLGSLILNICCIPLSIVVCCLKSSLVNEITQRKKSSSSPYMQHYKPVPPNSHEYGCPWLHLLANICEMLSCCLSMSCACQTSTVHNPDTPVLPSGTLTSR